MNVALATTFLAKKGIRVVKESHNTYRVWDQGGKPWENFRLYRTPSSFEWGGRDIIKLARCYKDSNQQTSIHKNVKKFSNDKDRTATRDAIKKGDFDKIPSKKRTAESDLWSWD